MRIAPGIGLAALFAFQAAASAQQFTVEPLKEAAPEAIAAPIRDLMEPQGYRVLADGKPHLDVWFRKAIPASAKPAGAKGSVLYPVLAEGELIGAARYAAEGQDFRDQVIAPGVYTLRYGLRLDDGNHANVSPYKDYALLLPADKDKEPALCDAPVAPPGLEEASSGRSRAAHLLWVDVGVQRFARPAAPCHPLRFQDQLGREHI